VMGEYICLSLRDGQLYFPSTIFRPSGTENIIYVKKLARPGLAGARKNYLRYHCS